jgi:hypothetical protein
LIRAQFAIAAVAAVAIALEPQQLLYERFVMTESFSTAVFTLLLLLALEYIRSRKAWLLIPMQLTGIVLVAFRLTYLPMLMVATVLGPIWAMMVSGGRDFVALSRHVVISVLLFFGLHTAYKQWNGWLSNLPAAYSYADGFFLISNVSPLITAADTDTPELIPVLAQPRVYGSDVAQFNSRNAEMFAPDGLVAQMERVLGADYRANVEAKRIAYHAIRRDPIGLVRLAFQTYLKFYSREYMSEILRFEAGMSELEPEQLKTLALYHLDAKGLPSMKTLTRGYYLRAWPFYILLGLTPLILLVCSLLYRGETALILSFLLVITTVHVAAVQVLGVEPSPRHLHSVSVVLAIAVGALAGYPRQNQSSRKN